SFWVTFPLRQDIVEKYGTGWARPGRMATVGPFNLASHEIDSKIVLTANPRYHGKHGNIDQAVGIIVRDDTTALKLYQTGKLDFVNDLSSLDLVGLEGSPELKTFPYLKTAYMGFVTTKFPASQTKVRRAIAMAIDKSKLGMFLHGGQK